MQNKKCPDCNAILVEDGDETVEVDSSGDILIDAYLALVCSENCGYSELMSVDELETIQQGPNLFHYATSELSQDAFLCWFLEWSHHKYQSVDSALHETAVRFVKSIFEGHYINLPSVDSIEIHRQFKNLDILALVNDQYAILIEDKTYTANHSNQLKRYREAIKESFPTFIQLPVYYKIIEQSRLHNIGAAGYLYFSRNRMLEVLEDGKAKGVTNSIFIDYLRHLQELDKKVNAFQLIPVNEWSSYAWQGFFHALQQELEGGWGYVPNPSKGFWAFWWHPYPGSPIYLQLEEERFCVKVHANDNVNRRELRNKTMQAILEKSQKSGMPLKRPQRLGNGKTMTVAISENYFIENSRGLVDLGKTVEQLKRWESYLQ